jgi:hypothetical protein
LKGQAMFDVNNNTHYETTQQLVSKKTGNRVKLLLDTSRMFNSNIYCDMVNYDILHSDDVITKSIYDEFVIARDSLQEG